MAEPGHLLIFGLGYSGAAIGAAAAAVGFRVTGTTRRGDLVPSPGVAIIPFDAAEVAIATATHIVPTAAPGDDGDPALARYRAAIMAAPIGTFTQKMLRQPTELTRRPPTTAPVTLEIPPM